MKIFDDYFDRYPVASGSATLMNGVWSSVGAGSAIVIPPNGARTGSKCLAITGNNNTTVEGARLSFRGSAPQEFFLALALYVPNLPSNSTRFRISLRSGGGLDAGYISIGTSGQIIARDRNENQIAATSPGAISAATWHFFEIRVLNGTGTGEFEVRDEAGTVLVNASSLDWGILSGIGGLRFENESITNDGAPYYVDDLSVKDTAGTFMNTWYAVGGVKNVLLLPVADDPASGWDFVARKIFDTGTGRIAGDGDNGFSVADAASLEIGSGDFTIEAEYRWRSLPATGTTRVLASKWREATNERSWRLIHYESLGGYFLSFEISTDGAAGTVTVVHDFPFTPDLYRPYAISVSRDTSTNRLFIEGVRKGPAVSDSATYYDGAARVAIGAEQNAASSLQNSFGGWVDEARLTVGVGRYTSEYTPATAKFPRDMTDPSWASVQLLLGFDDELSADDSSAARTVTVNGAASAQLALDGDAAYQSIDKVNRDDTFIEAALLPATGALEFTQNPAATENVVVGSKTYTYVSSLSSPNDILIGADPEESTENLRAAINGDAGEGTTYGTGTTANADAFATDLPGAILEIEALTAGTAGNSITFTTTVTNAVISGSGTLEGGTDIPSAGLYTLDRLPPGITRVESVSLFTRRNIEGPGSANIQPGIVDSSLSISNGANTPAPANPADQVDQFDDNGGAAWTIADFVGAKFRANRTS